MLPSRRGWAVAAAAVTCSLATAGAAWGVVTTVTNPPDATAVASCPGTATTPCTVVSRTTALQDVVGPARLPMRIRRRGRIVGWQITLGAPTSSQISYFDAHEGGPPEAAVAVLRHVRGLDYRLVAMTPMVQLAPYLGRTTTFPLVTSIAVIAGDELALSVPTWAPALELQAGYRTAWRASRAAGHCADVTAQTAQITPGNISPYGCIYQTALVSFGGVEITTPYASTTETR
jgi:hypothetical protein